MRPDFILVGVAFEGMQHKFFAETYNTTCYEDAYPTYDRNYDPGFRYIYIWSKDTGIYDGEGVLHGGPMPSSAPSTINPSVAEADANKPRGSGRMRPLRNVLLYMATYFMGPRELVFETLDMLARRIRVEHGG